MFAIRAAGKRGRPAGLVRRRESLFFKGDPQFIERHPDGRQRALDPQAFTQFGPAWHPAGLRPVPPASRGRYFGLRPPPTRGAISPVSRRRCLSQRTHAPLTAVLLGHLLRRASPHRSLPTPASANPSSTPCIATPPCVATTLYARARSRRKGKNENAPSQEEGGNVGRWANVGRERSGKRGRLDVAADLLSARSGASAKAREQANAARHQRE